jgi:putative iron-regulated protein
MKKLLYTFVLLSFCVACKEDENPLPALKKQFAENYASLVYQNYSDALAKAQTLKTKIDELAAVPTQAKFDECKTAWKEARIPYGQTEAFRFSEGPIDDEDGPEGQLNAWPMDEVYIDYVVGNATSGIINNAATYPSITAELLKSLNEAGGEANISTGFHAVEFLLWGQDNNTGSAGTRPYTDFVSGVGGTAANQQRRGQYLKVVAEIIVADLQSMADEWKPNANNFRKTFVENADESVGNVLKGIAEMSKGELGGERMTVAYDSQLQEDEHSCFSDNTHIDIQMNAKGLQNVFLGKYGSSITGTGLYDIIKEKNATLAEAIKTLLSQSVAACEAIPAPFDQQILSANTAGRQKVLAAINLLSEQGDKISEAIALLGYDL